MKSLLLSIITLFMVVNQVYDYEVKTQNSHKFTTCNTSFYMGDDPCQPSWGDVCYDDTAPEPWVLNSKYVSTEEDQEDPCDEYGLC